MHTCPLRPAGQSLNKPTQDACGVFARPVGGTGLCHSHPYPYLPLPLPASAAAPLQAWDPSASASCRSISASPCQLVLLSNRASPGPMQPLGARSVAVILDSIVLEPSIDTNTL